MDCNSTHIPRRSLDLPVVDTQLLVYQPGDSSASMRIDVGAVSTATTRVLTMPDQDVDLTPGTGTFAAETHTHDASDIDAGTLTHERGGLEFDASAVDYGDLIIGDGAGSMALLTTDAASDGDVLTVQADGSIAWETIAVGAVLPAVDTTAIVKDPADATKTMRIDVGAVSTATTRVLTMPDQDVDLTPWTGTFAATFATLSHERGGLEFDASSVAKGDLIIGTGTGTMGLLAGSAATEGQVPTIQADGSLTWASSAAALPRGYIDGYRLINSGGANVQVSAGSGRDSTNTVDLHHTSTVSKTLGTWAVGSGNGSIVGPGGTTTVQANTWYHVHAIRKDSDGSVDFCLDTDVDADNRPVGYTYFRRLGSVKTNGSSTLVGWSHRGDEFLWDRPTVSALHAASDATREVDVPPDLQVWALLTVTVYVASDDHGYGWVSSLDQDIITTTTGDNEATANASALPPSAVGGGVTGAGATTNVRVRTNTSQQVYVATTGTDPTSDCYTATWGWIDPRGKDA